MIKNFRFCPRCGGALKKETTNLYICSKCGFHLYINPKPSNALIITTTNNEILLVKRKFNPKKDFWDLPGGFVNLNENLEESLIREIKEELGIKINQFQYFHSYPDKYLYQEINFPALCGVFFTKISNKILQQIKPSDDVKEVKLFKFREIPFNRIAFPSMKEALRNFLSSR